MLIFISDLHLTDGTFDYMKDGPDNHIAHDVSHEAFKLFWDQVYRIYQANESEHNIEEIKLVLSDLLGRLMFHVQAENNKELICFCMDIDNVRPSSDRFTWIVTNINRLSDTSLETLKRVLLTGIGELRDETDEIFDFLYERVKGKFKFIHKVLLGIISIFTNKEKFLKKWITKKLSKIEHSIKKKDPKELKDVFEGIQRLMSKLRPKKKKKKEPQDQDFHYYKRAEEESEKGYNFVIFGHSHRYKLIPLALHGERKVFYFNSGTWRRTVQKNLFPLETKEPVFQKWTRMTYVTFFDYEKQENKGHVFDVWHGNLQREEEREQIIVNRSARSCLHYS